MRHIFLLFISLSLISCYEVERSCTDFKTGTFEFEQLVGTEMLKTTFVRKGAIEIDYFQGKQDTSSVRWINDCEYIVQNINPKNMAEEKAIHIKIISTTSDTYLFEYSVVGDSRKEKGTARKIQD